MIGLAVLLSPLIEEGTEEKMAPTSFFLSLENIYGG